MRGITRSSFLAAVLVITAACKDPSTAPTATRQSGGSPAYAVAGGPGFGFNGTASGFPAGSVFLTGGGTFDPATASNTVPTATQVVANGGFRCITGIGQGPLTGCATGEGVRWDTRQLLASTSFKCTPAGALKPVATGAGTAVLLADFYRAGDGNDESFTAQMIVSDSDLTTDVPGVQNIWIQGVGCGSAVVHFSK